MTTVKYLVGYARLEEVPRMISISSNRQALLLINSTEHCFENPDSRKLNKIAFLDLKKPLIRFITKY